MLSSSVSSALANQVGPVCLHAYGQRVSRDPKGFGDFRTARLVAEWKRTAPKESQLATGRIIEALASRPGGLSKEEILDVVAGPDFRSRSFRYRLAVETALNKRLQRARRRIRAFGLDVVFDRETFRWVLAVAPQSAEDLH